MNYDFSKGFTIFWAVGNKYAKTILLTDYSSALWASFNGLSGTSLILDDINSMYRPISPRTETISGMNQI